MKPVRTAGFFANRHDRRTAFGRFWANRPASISLFVLAFIALTAVFGPFFVANPYKVSGLIRKGPSSAHWFGTDQVGRDEFARVIYGSRTSLTVGIISALSVTVIGVIVGLIAGWKGGTTDSVLMRLVDVVLAFPYIILALMIVAVIGAGIRAILVVATVVGFGGVARLLRGEVKRVSSLDYVDAARSTGAKDSRIMLRHVLPNSIQPIAVTAAGSVADFIVVEAALSFLGRGIQEPKASWGLMIARSRTFFEEAPHLLFAPGFALIVLSLALVFVGDGVRDAIDPRVEQRFF
jgi:peptide/nickel transport system permease protein